jgi:hypothetical protein
MALAAATRHRESQSNQIKPRMYKSRRKSSAAELTLGGVGRLPRVLHLEPKAGAAAWQESVRAKPNPWLQPGCNTREEKMGEGDLTMAATGERGASRRMGCVCGGGERGGEGSGGGRSERGYVGGTELGAKTLMGSLRTEPPARPL